MNFSGLEEIIAKYEKKLIPAENLFFKPTLSHPQKNNELHVFYHHIYEFKKGLRNLVLVTEKIKNKCLIEKRLKKENINYIIHEISDTKINVYFGHKSCIDVVSEFDPRLNKISPEQDFILGVMLGYDRIQQCERYLKIKANKQNIEDLIG